MMFVLSAHLFAICLLYGLQPTPPQTSLRNTVAVRTIQVSNPYDKTPVSPLNDTPSTAEVQREPEPEPLSAKKPVHRKQLDTPLTPHTMKPRLTTPPHGNYPATPTQPPTFKPAPRNIPNPTADTPSASPPHKDQLLSLMQQSLQSLNNSGTQTVAMGKIAKAPKPIDTLASERISFESKYEEDLVDYLEAFLSFPEMGEVKLKLTLKKEGSLKKMEIIKASSERNKNYLESTLANCSFPPFGKFFKGEEAHTFTITLRAENSR